MIPIPIGTTHVSRVRGAVWKLVSCERCIQRYAYLLELEATGEDRDLLFLDGKGSAERARAQAEQNLLRKSRNCVLPVPCPNCGFYQDEMARQLKEEAWINRFQVAGLAISVMSLLPLALDIPFIWVLTLVTAAIGLTLLIYGYVAAFRFDPNSGDAEATKALGRSYAVWGEQLAELLATNPTVAANDAADRRQDARSSET